ncbi:MAG: histidine--tRNA ligase [Desulfonatronovibrionaceae bacterium]
MTKIKKIKGFSDQFPPESEIFARMEEIARRVFSRYGCKELRLPLLEKTELFSRSIGGDTDIVQKEMYTFPDRKGRSLTLRPEATAGVVRAYIESQLYARENVGKYYTLGPMFRYERPQKGRTRQFHQVNVEVLGPQSPIADAELVMMLVDYLHELGLKDVRIELNSLGCPECRPGFHAALSEYLQGLDPEELCGDCRERMDKNPLRVLDCKVPACRELVQKAPRIVDYLCSKCESHFQTVKTALVEAGIKYSLNPFLVRGLDYYQRTTFEAVSSDIGAQASVAGGGRYDGLVKALGGPDLPGLGFACGMERLALLMDWEPGRALDFYLAVLDEEAMDTALLLGQQLRGSGYKGEVSFEAASPRSQLRLANKLEAKTCLLIGRDEMSRGEVMVKDMETGVQRAVSQEDLEQAVGLKR